jgi:SAM-dependent methyltransferase
MSQRHSDGSAGDANYGAIGKSYSNYRQPEPRIAALINEALGNARTILNVGAGAGSYEPTDRDVTAIEPSASMRAQRPAHLSIAIDGVAEKIPFHDNHFDAAMGTFTIHQWSDLKAGLAEMRRVTRGPVLILTCDPAKVQSFWLNDYAPDVLSTEARRYPSMNAIREGFGGEIEIRPVPIPLDCLDGFNEAYYGRPEMLLEDGARLSCSAWSFVPSEVAASYIEQLRSDLQTGRWDEKYGQLRSQPVFNGSLYLVISPGL